MRVIIPPMLGNVGMDPINKPVTETLNALRLQAGAGVPLIKSLKTCSRVCRHPRARAAFAKAAEQVEQRASFNDILKTLSVVLPYPEQAVLAAGWDSGKIEWALKSVVERRELLFETRRYIRSQLWYPGMMFFAVCFIPNLPGLILGKLTGARYLQLAFSPIALVTAVVCVSWFVNRLAVWSYAKRGLDGTPPPSTPLSYLSLSVPIYAYLQKCRNRSEFSNLMASLLNAGLGIVRSLAICGRALPNGVYRKAVARYSERTKAEGGALFQYMAKDKVLWPFEWIPALEVAYESGKEDEVLARLAAASRESYMRAVKTAAAAFTKLIYVGISIMIIIQIFKLAGAYLGALEGAMGG